MQEITLFFLINIFLSKTLNPEWHEYKGEKQEDVNVNYRYDKENNRVVDIEEWEIN